MKCSRTDPTVLCFSAEGETQQLLRVGGKKKTKHVPQNGGQRMSSWLVMLQSHCKYPNGVDRNQWNRITERRLQSEHTDDTWRCRLCVHVNERDAYLFQILFKIILLFTVFKFLFQGKNLSCLVVVGSADGWPVTLEDFVFAAVAEMCFICTFKLQTRPAETQRKLNRPETKDGRITCLTSSSVSSFYPSLRVRTETIMAKHKRFCLDEN